MHAEAAAERCRVHAALDLLSLRHTRLAATSFFLRTPPVGRVHAAAAAGTGITHSFTPLNDWVRVTIGLSSENDRFYASLRGVVR
ncbi:hypothetical protein [Sphingomonas melonis]|uniref:Histidinol-phosphate/aromatic aminotransferase/cobyric acid decarboxylase-like protein n=1 Tax=Sphingomonas melonis TaxID=152682 RepID=A0A7Y9K1L1_9SPHN|nr:hypothetical protein [Sphingomonas melonis]NYD89044.1 histidinol-phosphate/aromatic aminotransferase/cobyric acid decarboxylase-like protein [Sphingomonas melonis]